MDTTGASPSKPAGSDEPFFNLLEGTVRFDFTACPVCGAVTSARLAQVSGDNEHVVFAGNPKLHAEYHEHLRGTIKGLGERIVRSSHSHKNE